MRVCDAFVLISYITSPPPNGGTDYVFPFSNGCVRDVLCITC